MPVYRASAWQAVFQRQIGNALLQSARLTAQVATLIGCGRTARVTSQMPLPCLHELFGPGVIKALGDTLAPAQLGNAVLATQFRPTRSGSCLRQKIGRKMAECSWPQPSSSPVFPGEDDHAKHGAFGASVNL